jgi:hypothetical protein
LLDILRRTHTPSPNSIKELGPLQLSAKVDVKVIIVWVLQWHIAVYFLEHGLGVMAHNKDVINITKDISIITRIVMRVSLGFIP